MDDDIQTERVTSTPFTPASDAPLFGGGDMPTGEEWPTSWSGPTRAPVSRTGSRPTGMASGTNYYPIGAHTLDNPMYPWLMPYQDEFTEPMSPFETEGLFGIYDYVGGGMGLGGSEDYLDDVIGGRYLDPSTNRWLEGIRAGAAGLKEIQDQQARRRIGSSMAAGGHALSGARLGAEQDYQNESDARFQQMISELMSGHYTRERGLQQGAVPLRAGLSDQRLGGQERLMAAGALPRQLGQADRNAQYGDWLRQIGSLEEAYRYPDMLAASTLGRGYPGSYQPQFGESAFAGLLGLLSPLLQRLLTPGSGNQQSNRTPIGGGTAGPGGSSSPGTRPSPSRGNGQTDPWGRNIPPDMQGGTWGQDPWSGNIEYRAPDGNTYAFEDDGSFNYGYGQVYDEPIGPEMPPGWGEEAGPTDWGAGGGDMWGSGWGDIYGSGGGDMWGSGWGDIWGSDDGGGDLWGSDWGDIFGGDYGEPSGEFGLGLDGYDWGL